MKPASVNSNFPTTFGMGILAITAILFTLIVLVIWRLPMSRECAYLTEEEAGAFAALGWTIHGGPYPTSDECLAECFPASPGTATSSVSPPTLPLSSSCVSCPDTPALNTYYQWDIAMSGGTGDYAVLNGTHRVTQTLPSTSCDWVLTVDNVDYLLEFNTVGSGTKVWFTTPSGSGTTFFLRYEQEFLGHEEVCTEAFTVPFLSTSGSATGTPPSSVSVTPGA